MTSSATVLSSRRPSTPIAPVEARLRRAIARIADSACPILIFGERGAGKHTVAAQIHSQSHRPRNGYTEVRSADADPGVLLPAFSGNGTVYLDEIGDLSLPLQEFIVSSYFHSEKAQTCRLVCGTSRDIFEDVKTWRMREDFYYLISALTLRISPLRLRRSEILSIADELLLQYSRQFDRPKLVLRKEIIEYLMEDTWPGNLSEPDTANKTIVAIGDQSISLAVLKASPAAFKSSGHCRPLRSKEATRTATTQIERQMNSEVLMITGGNRKRAADQLGISYKALLYKLKQGEAGCLPTSNANGAAL
jgi:two-component system response regulator AtoC